MNLACKTFTGAEIAAIVPELGALRIAVFRDFPYLYEGSREYERKYLQAYVAQPLGFCFTVWDKGQLVGATTSLPLSHESPEVRQPFTDAGFDASQIDYFGESILLQDYRGQGIGHRFFDEREKFALENGFTITAFCSVIRAEDHPLKPANYRSNEAFWAKRGYVRHPELTCTMSWPDIGSAISTPKQLEFYLKEWSK